MDDDRAGVPTGWPHTCTCCTRAYWPERGDGGWCSVCQLAASDEPAEVECDPRDILT